MHPKHCVSSAHRSRAAHSRAPAAPAGPAQRAAPRSSRPQTRRPAAPTHRAPPPPPSPPRPGPQEPYLRGPGQRGPAAGSGCGGCCGSASISCSTAAGQQSASGVLPVLAAPAGVGPGVDPSRSRLSTSACVDSSLSGPVGGMSRRFQNDTERYCLKPGAWFRACMQYDCMRPVTYAVSAIRRARLAEGEARQHALLHQLHHVVPHTQAQHRRLRRHTPFYQA